MTKRIKGKNPNMKITTINVPTKFINIFKSLKDLGIYASVSEGIRSMMSEWLSMKLSMIEKVDLVNQLTKETKKLKAIIKPKITVEELISKETYTHPDGSKTTIREYRDFVTDITDEDGFIKVQTHQKAINEE